MFATIADRYPSLPGPPADALRGTLADQLGAGLGMVSDGRVWTVVDDVSAAAAVDAWRTARGALRALADERGIDPVPLKACLVGPRPGTGAGTAGAGTVGALREAILALFAAGVPLVQLEHPGGAGRAGEDVETERLVDAWRAALEGVEGHLSLALPGGATSIGADALAGGPFASYLLDLVHHPDDWRVAARLPGDRGLVLGVADERATRPGGEPVLAWAVRYAASLGGRGPARVALAPAGGLDALPRETARAILAAAANAARLAALPPEQRAATTDPRAVDARSAALGRWEPRTRRRREP